MKHDEETGKRDTAGRGPGRRPRRRGSAAGRPNPPRNPPPAGGRHALRFVAGRDSPTVAESPGYPRGRVDDARVDWRTGWTAMASTLSRVWGGISSALLEEPRGVAVWACRFRRDSRVRRCGAARCCRSWWRIASWSNPEKNGSAAGIIEFNTAFRPPHPLANSGGEQNPLGRPWIVSTRRPRRPVVVCV
jgi:hypothetical protein